MLGHQHIPSTFPKLPVFLFYPKKTSEGCGVPGSCSQPLCHSFSFQSS